ncbi:unnamed protein product [Adineta ricciae]|uniref:Protein YIPF n=1 Tax=Adineta ricciae TaxID=249248 RepID=A0A814HKZ2_ADIRI|nr:unnamed protein product [Adineta ricciae]
MFSDDGFLSEKFSNQSPSQTHIFTSFPNSAVDPDDDDLSTDNKPANNLSYEYNPSNSQPSSLPLPATANTSKDEQFHIWQLEYYQTYFQIDTQQVIERLLASMTPRPNKSYFDSTIRQNPDLYGPFWVCITFIITVAVSGNILTYFYVPDADFQIDFSKITLSAIFICFYWWLMPTCIYFFFRWHLKRIEYTFVELLCVYGYSLTIFIPISILWMISISWLQWLLTILGSVISGSVLIVTFWPTINSDRQRFNALSMLLMLFLHLAMAISIMLVFFHVSDKNIPTRNPTTLLTTVIPSVKNQI